jgi:tetratricopeptide (TPR) repeat protein
MPRQNQPARYLIHWLAARGGHALALATLVVCMWGANSSARAGLSRLLSEFASATNSLAAARRALDFNDADPSAHYAYAVELAKAGKNSEVIASLRRAVSLRPDDYFLWQELGRLQEDSDTAGSLRALRRATELAPHYSEPHWQLGNVLLRKSDFATAFTEMRIAVESDPTLFPMMIDLAWGVCDADVNCALAITAPQTDTERVSLGSFLIAQKNVDAGVSLVMAPSSIAAEDRRKLVAGLIDAGEFKAAYRIWFAGVSAGNAKEDDFYDGGFEVPISLDDLSFGWLPSEGQTIHVLLDPNDPQSGSHSLLLEYAGNFAPTAPVISQLILVAPNARYRLNFAARTEGLVSAALPVVVIKNAAGDQSLIAQSLPLSAGTNGWRVVSIDFETTDSTKAVKVSIQRQACSSNPCPIVGRAGFDSFSLKRLEPTAR